MNTQDQLERLRQLDVDVDELLDAAVSLAEIRRDVRTKATETPLPPGDPGNLSRVLVVPAVDEEDVDPVALLWSAVAMAMGDQHPALALHVAAAAPVGTGGPLANVRATPKSIFSPEVAQHVSRLIDCARRPGRPQWIEGEAGPVPLFDDRFLHLPAALAVDADKLARIFLDTFRDPLHVHDEILVERISGLDAQKPAPPPPAPTPQPVDPEDVPLGQLPPRPETEAEAEARQAAEALRQAEAARQEAAWQSKRLALADETVLVLRHAAQRAVEKLLQAVGQRPSDALHPFTLSLVAEALDELPKGERVQLLADCLDVHPKTVIRALSVWKKKYRVRPRHRGHSSTAQCPRNRAQTRPNLSPGAASAERSARKKEPTDADDHRPETQPTPPEVCGVSVRLPAGRPPATQRNQRKPVALDDRPRRGQSHPTRKDGPGPEK